MLYRIAILTFFGLLVSCTAFASDSLKIRFDRFSAKEGLTLSITAIGDSDGETIFNNQSCCGIENPQRFISDVRVRSAGHLIATIHNAAGWTVHHAPRASLTLTYRLRPSGATTIDSGPLDQFRPIVQQGSFHLMGEMALLLPMGRADSDLVELDVDATRVANDKSFVSSYGPGNVVRGAIVPRSQIRKALFRGGAISLTVRDTPSGKIGVAYDAMDPAIQADDLRSDVFAILKTEREFFNDAQPWYLVSVHGGKHLDSNINLGGGTGLNNALAVFAWSGLDFVNGEQHRAQFRWVVAHEYLHQWNGLSLRVASRQGSDEDDTSAYWFSEGVTDFYTMRLLTRAGLQSPDLSLAVLNDRLRRYAANSRRDLSAQAVGALFWSDADGGQIPYLRGYLAAWYADLALRSASNGRRDLDSLMRVLVARAKSDPDFRLDNSFLANYLSEGLPAETARRLRGFVIDGGESPLDTNSFAPCLVGKREGISGNGVLQFDFSDEKKEACFRH
jgi:hypothetical protein